MILVDTHVHMDDDAFAGDLQAVLARSRERCVERWINVGYNERRWETTLALVASIPGMSCMLGLHPGNADDWCDAVGERLCALIDAEHPVAVGEIGLDLHWRQDNLHAQRVAFRSQLEIARERALPAVIHMRAADDEMLAQLRDLRDRPRLHFHSFDGNADLRDWVAQNGATIGVGGLITRRGTEALQAWVADLPRERVVLETDSPYLKPRGIRGTRNEPVHLLRTAELLARLWGTDLETVASTTTANAVRIFGLAKGLST